MTNPNDNIGTNAGYNGRTSSKAFNDVLSVLSRGVLSGWTCEPSSGMTVTVGGTGSERDVAIAEDNAGNRTTINNRLGTPVSITLDASPSTNNRIDSIVAYAEGTIQGQGSTDVDFPSGVGIITVSGTVAANPTAPDDTAIRNAITADGATGSSAFYVVLAEILVGTSVSTIGAGSITQGAKAQLASDSGASIQAQILRKFNLTNSTSQTFTSSYLGSNVTANGIMNLAQSEDSSIFKAYGNLYITRSQNSATTVTLTAIPGRSGSYGIKTTLKLDTPPTTAFEIQTAGTNLRVNSDNSNVTGAYQVSLAVGTDGYIYLGPNTTSTLSVSASSQLRWMFYPCVYYNTNFGDEQNES